MKTKLLLWIDRYVVRTFVGVLNVFVIIVGKLLRLNHNLDRNFNTIYVAKYKGMGSIIQSIPLLHGLRNKYPDATIIYVSTKANEKMLLQLRPLIQGSILLDDSSLLKLMFGFPSFIFKLIKRRGDVFIDLELYADTASVFATLSMSTNRIGYYQRSSHYRTGIYTHMLFFNLTTPIAENYKQMGRLLGVDSFEEKHNIKLNEYKIDRSSKYIVINPNASDLRLERRWPLKYYQQLIHQVHERYNGTIYLIGGPSEVEYVGSLMSVCNHLERVINLAGKTPFEELIKVIANAEMVITNDSGPLHLSLYFDRPTIALFGPCHPQHYGVVKSNVYTHYVPVYCSPCVHEFSQAPCNGNNICMQEIKVDDVLQSFIDLGNGKTQSKQIYLPIYNVESHVLGKLKVF